MVHKCKIVTGLLITIGLLWLLGFIWFSHSVFAYIKQPDLSFDNPRKVGIAVLTGGRYRIKKGLDLLEQGVGSRMLISGVQTGVRLDEIAAIENVNLYDDMPIDLGYKARTTVGNAKEIKEWADKNGFEIIYAVTSFYHIPRSRLELEHLLENKEIYFTAVSSGYVRKHWWRHWGSFKFLCAEYCKYLAVFMQYKLGL